MTHPRHPALPWLLALLALTAWRLWVAAMLPLSPDEAYYWVWSRALQPGYLDHPPMVALLIRAGTALLGDGALGVRLLGPLAAAAGTLLLVHTAELLFPRQGVGWPAAALLNATLLLAVGAVTITPDTPLLLFWTASMAAAARAVARKQGAWWLAAGLAAGLALDSKYTAFLLGAGYAAWLLLHPAGRAWLRTPWPYLGGMLAIAVFAPVLWWNAAHGWASFLKQGGRTGDWRPAQAWRFLGELLGGQAGLATPLVFLLAVGGAVAALRRMRDPAWALLAALSVPGALVFLQHALGDRVQANWPSILYPAALLAAAARFPRWWKPAAALGLVLGLLVTVQAAFAPLPLRRGLDPTLARLGGWDAFGAAVAGRAGGAAWVASEDYGLASELARTLPAELPVIGVEPRWAVFDLPSAGTLLRGGEGMLVQSARRREPPDPAFWQAREAGTLTRTRGGVVAEEYKLYRAIPVSPPAAVLLPGPRP
jgi:4-amino-4-deoxy-L-arabinose transferase-like glycosyltransferase